MKADVILWDYDGTLVNSVPKNIAITKEILAVAAPRLTGENLPHWLASEEDYHVANHQSKNWQDLYMNYYGMTEAETKYAGSLWTEYQIKNTTTVHLFAGIADTIQLLDVPHGICSQNSSENINRLLNENKLLEKFNAVIGYSDIAHHEQKPLPAGGIKCLRQIFGETKSKTVFYVGDHEGDVQFARNLSNELHNSNTVISIIVTYSGADTSLWKYKPDFEIAQPQELITLAGML